MASIFVPTAMIFVVLWQSFYRRENRLMALFLLAIVIGGSGGFLRQFAQHPLVTADFLVAFVLIAFLLSSSTLLGFVLVLVAPERRGAIWWAYSSIGFALASVVLAPFGFLYTNAALWGVSLVVFDLTTLLGLLIINAFLHLVYLVVVTVQAHKRLPSPISWGVYTFVIVYVAALVYPPFVEMSLSLFSGLIYSVLFSYAIFSENHLNPLVHLNQQLQESEARYRAIVDMVFDLDYVIEYAENGGYTFNWTKDSHLLFSHFPTHIDLQLSELRRHIYPAHHDTLDAFALDVLHGKPREIEFEVAITPRQKLWIRNYVYPVWDDEKKMAVRAYGVARNITEEKHAEQALVASEGRFRAMFSHALHMIALFDGDGCFIESNEMTHHFSGIEDTHFVGKHILELHKSIGKPSEAAAAKKFIEPVFNGITARGEWQLRDRYGVWRNLDVSLRPIEQVDGKPSLLLLEANDITERKQAIATMIQAQKVESLGVLAGGVAHDFNNLLTGILAQSSLALHKLGDGSRAGKNIEKVIVTAEHAATLAQKMLAYAGRADFVLEPFDLNNAIQNNVDLFRASTGANVSLKLALDANIPLILADRGQIQQIVMNLMINAAEAIGLEQGYVEVETKIQEWSQTELKRFVSKTPLDAGLYVLLVVRDNGCGISADVKDRIFDPFFSTKAEGRGLGLAALLGAIYAQSGGICVDSVEHVGTQFHVLFPITADLEVHLNPSIDFTDSVWKTDKKYTIMLAEDEASIRDVVVEGCELLGWTIYTADNGRDALSLYEQHQDDIDVVILDMQMPIMSGTKAYWMLKEMRADLPVIISSGYDPNDSAQYTRAHEPILFLQKPYRIEALMRAILDLLTGVTRQVR